MSTLHVELKHHPLYRRLRHQIGKAVADFGMIQEGDRIAVGLSGGKFYPVTYL